MPALSRREVIERSAKGCCVIPWPFNQPVAAASPRLEISRRFADDPQCAPRSSGKLFFFPLFAQTMHARPVHHEPTLPSIHSPNHRPNQIQKTDYSPPLCGTGIVPRTARQNDPCGLAGLKNRSVLPRHRWHLLHVFKLGSFLPFAFVVAVLQAFGIDNRTVFNRNDATSHRFGGL